MKTHEHLYKAAIRLSVYSSILDFGLMLSVFLINSKLLPYTFSSFLMGAFSTGISYITAIIIGLFSVSFVLRTKQKIITIKAVPVEKKMSENPKIKVIISGEQREIKPAVVKVKEEERSQLPFVQRVSNGERSFLRINGLWYSAEKDRLERVKTPVY